MERKELILVAYAMESMNEVQMYSLFDIESINYEKGPEDVLLGLSFNTVEKAISGDSLETLAYRYMELRKKHQDEYSSINTVFSLFGDQITDEIGVGAVRYRSFSNMEKNKFSERILNLVAKASKKEKEQ